jgi:hypothetical protein
MDSAAQGPGQPDVASEDADAAALRARREELARRLDRVGLPALRMAEANQTLALRATARDQARLDAALSGAAAPDAALPDAAPAAPIGPPAESNGPTLSFARAARVVRNCIAVELKIAAPLAAPRKAELARRLDRLGLLALDLAEATEKLALCATRFDHAVFDVLPLDVPTPRGASEGPNLSFARAARVLRDCVAMELRIITPPAGRREAARAGAWTRKRLNAMKGEVRQHVEKSIRTNAEPRHVNQMLFALDARLDKPEIAADFGTRTLGQIVLGVCRDLEVDPDLTGWSDEMLHTAYAAVRNWEWKPPAPAPKHGRAIGLKPDPTIEKLPTGVIGTPGVPPAMDVPPWPHPAPGGAPPAGPDPPAAARPPGVVFTR